MKRKFQPNWLICLISFAIFLAGCQSKPEIVPPTATTEITLPFDTIEILDTPGTGQYYEGSGPKLVIIRKKEDIDTLGNTISKNAQETLRNLDYNEKIAVIVFQSENGDWISVKVQKVTIKNNLITIEANIIKRNPEYEFLDVRISPYHVISLRKEGLGPENEFKLVISFVLNKP